MKVYELIQALARFDADLEVVAQRSGNKRQMRIISPHRPIPIRHSERTGIAPVTLMLDWKDEQ